MEYFNKKLFLWGIALCLIAMLAQFGTQMTHINLFATYFMYSSLVTALASGFCFYASSWAYKVQGHTCLAPNMFLYKLAKRAYLVALICMVFFAFFKSDDPGSYVSLICLASSSTMFSLSKVFGSEENVEAQRDMRFE